MPLRRAFAPMLPEFDSFLFAPVGNVTETGFERVARQGIFRHGSALLPPPIIQHAIWLYLRFTLSYRDVEELLAERGVDISYETVRRWVLKFGPEFARRLRQGRAPPSAHLDE